VWLMCGMRQLVRPVTHGLQVEAELSALEDVVADEEKLELPSAPKTKVRACVRRTAAQAGCAIFRDTVITQGAAEGSGADILERCPASGSGTEY
jgi:hypothetical protein